MFKFQDFDGKIVALRPEMTTPIARIITTKMFSMPKPLRLFYICNVFRYGQSHFEKMREFRQAGVELIGSNTPEADGEAISLFISCLKTLGLKSVRVDLAHAGLLKQLLKDTNLSEENMSLFRRLLATRNMEQLESLMNKFSISSQIRELFLQLSNCKKPESLAAIAKNSTKFEKLHDFLNNLLEIRDVLNEYKIGDSVFFDFSLTRGIEYYTGVVFEASVPNMGLSLGGGGRYDNLIEKFGGLKVPAIGFALGVEKCLLALNTQGFVLPKSSECKILIASKNRKAAMEAVNLLRNGRITCLLNPENSNEDPIRYAKLCGINYVIFVESSIESPLIVYDVESDSKKRTKIEDFIESLGAALRI